jgi:hypothetical protein
MGREAECLSFRPRTTRGEALSFGAADLNV